MLIVDGKVYNKLNLGSGQRRGCKFPWPWLNVDCQGEEADFICDIRRLPFEWTAAFQEVRASHVLEHFFLAEMRGVLCEWVRVLEPGGLLRIIVPDLEIVLQCLMEKQDMKGRLSTSIKETTAVMAQVYGIDYDKPETSPNWRHRFIFSCEILVELVNSHPELERVSRYAPQDDPAVTYGISDDSQNPFSLAVMARKKGG